MAKAMSSNPFSFCSNADFYKQRRGNSVFAIAGQWRGNNLEPTFQLKSIVNLSWVHSNRSSVTVGCSVSEAAGESNPQGQDSQINTAEMSAKLAKLGLAAVLAYGLFDGVTYTTFFVLAFLGYEKSTGKNPAANLQTLLGIVILMWTGNNVTRPFRVAGAAALAPIIDKGLKRIQKYFNFPSPIFAFALVVSIVAASCLTVVGLLILSRWGK